MVSNSGIPKVTVIVCAYQSGESILPTLKSILDQSFTDFEFIVIDDASGDETPDIIRSIADSRIKLVENPDNMGVVGSRNKGVAMAQGEFIAHCDHDDIWQPEKLAKQVAFLDSNPDCGLVSTNIAKFHHGKNFSKGDQTERSSNYLRWSILLDSTFAHSAIMYRTKIVRENNVTYYPEYTFADDWDVFLQMAKLADIRCIPEPLTLYHLHDKNWTFRAGDKMSINGKKVFFKEINYWIDREVDKRNTDEYFDLIVTGIACSSPDTLLSVGHLLRELCESFLAKIEPTASEIGEIKCLTSEHWWKIVARSANQLGPTAGKYYRHSGTPNWNKVSALSRVKLAGKTCAKGLLRRVSSQQT